MTKPSRRAVLRAGVVGAAAAAGPLAVTGQALSVLPGHDGGLRRGTFKPNVGRRYRLTGDGGTHLATLKKVQDLRGAAKGHDLRFRLLFEVHGSTPEQGTYDVRHGRSGGVALFVTPIVREGLYEAVIDAVK